MSYSLLSGCITSIDPCLRRILGASVKLSSDEKAASDLEAAFFTRRHSVLVPIAMPAANDHRGSFGVVVAPAATIAGVLDFVPNKFLNKPQAPLRERFDDDATVMQVPKSEWNGTRPC